LKNELELIKNSNDKMKGIIDDIYKNNYLIKKNNQENIDESD
jgi:hypothetical protein